jgi:hypothetical protein
VLGDDQITIATDLGTRSAQSGGIGPPGIAASTGTRSRSPSSAA